MIAMKRNASRGRKPRKDMSLREDMSLGEEMLREDESLPRMCRFARESISLEKMKALRGIKVIKQEAAHVRRSKKLKSDGPAPLLRPCATSATLRHFHDPAPFPLLLYKASSTVRINAGLALLFPNPHPLHHRPPPRPGQAWRRATATPPRHRNSSTAITSCFISTAHHLLITKDANDLKLFFLNPHVLLLFRICPCLRTLLPLLLLQFSM